MSTLLIKILLEWSAKDLEMLQANVAFRLQHTTFSVLRLIPRLWYSYYLKFQNSKSKFIIYNRNLKFSHNSQFQGKIRNPKFTSMHTLILSSNLQSVTPCLTFSYSVPMHVMTKYNASKDLQLFFINKCNLKCLRYI